MHARLLENEKKVCTLGIEPTTSSRLEMQSLWWYTVVSQSIHIVWNRDKVCLLQSVIRAPALQTLHLLA